MTGVNDDFSRFWTRRAGRVRCERRTRPWALPRHPLACGGETDGVRGPLATGPSAFQVRGVLSMNRPFVVVLIVVLVLDWPTRFSRTRTTTRTIQFMVPMRGGKTVEAFHEPQKVAQASCLFGTDRLEACPTLQ
ncbi:MAG: hypothetical protein DME19_14510, partial [Verrucomicrobia bacterium]